MQTQDILPILANAIALVIDPAFAFFLRCHTWLATRGVSGCRPPRACPCGAQIVARYADLLRKSAPVKARHCKQGFALHPAGAVTAPAPRRSL